MIEIEHLQALKAETEQIIAQAAAAGSSSTAAAYNAQLSTIDRFIASPAATLEDAAGDAPNEPIVIQGVAEAFRFNNCGAPGCDVMAPCPYHQHIAWQEQVNKKWGGTIR
jgi:hypothetical protein